MSDNFIRRAFSVTELILSLFILAIVAVAAVSIAHKKTKTLIQNRAQHGKIVCNSDKINEGYKPILKYCDFYITNPTVIDSDDDKNKKTITNKKTNGYMLYDGDFYTEMQSKEFVTVKLRGGGAGGGSAVGGEAGEERVVVYPSLVRPLGCRAGYIINGTRCCENNGNDACDDYSSDKSICMGGYKMVNGACEVNFKYRITPGAGGGPGSNGEDTKIEILCIDKDEAGGCTRKNQVLGNFETAEGGKISNIQCKDGDDDCLAGKVPQNADGSTNSVESDSFGRGGNVNESGHDGEVIISW